MIRVVLDTSAYAWLQRGHAGLETVVLRAAWVGMPAATVGELRAGFALGGRADENEAVLEDFLASPAVEFLPVDLGTTARYGLLFAALRRAGTPIPTNDLWIAAAAAGSGGTLLSLDRDFDRVPGLVHRRFVPA